MGTDPRTYLFSSDSSSEVPNEGDSYINYCTIVSPLPRLIPNLEYAELQVSLCLAAAGFGKNPLEYVAKTLTGRKFILLLRN